ncbi:MAG TPA: SemiSWEET transporter [Burkholderiaceae bacterium]|nr:SemiSWEET transporter [Burkholderiaceae bacterium]
MTATDLVGTAAAILTTIAFIPQAWLIVKTRCTEGVSLGTYSIFTVGVALWLLYGVLLGAWPIVVANAITLSLSAFILFMKWISVLRAAPKPADITSDPHP